MSNAITRRQALAAGGALASAAALASLAGCSTPNQGWDGSTYLPIGTVVKLKACASTDVKHMVMTRRPKVSAICSLDANGNVTKTETNDVYDYALLIWPIGTYSDQASETCLTDITYANTSDISEVLFMGYQDEVEKSAQAVLESSRSAGTDAADALNNLLGTEFGHSLS